MLERLGRRGLHVVAPLQRGYAPTARPRDTRQYHLDLLVGDVLAMADDLGWRRFSVVGHDWGGVVAWAVAAGHPDRVERLAVLSTPHPAALVRALWRSGQALRSSYVGFFQLPVIPEFVLGAAGGRVLRAALSHSGLPSDWVDRYVEALNTRPALGAALAWYRANSLPTLAGVGPVDRPTLFAWSDGDPALGRAAAEATVDHVGGPYRFEVLEGASHWLPEGHADVVADLLLEHLAVAHPA